MTLFQRMRAPFGEQAEHDPDQFPTPAHGVGELLRERRLALGLDLDSTGEDLRIKPIYLAAIEQGRPEELPGPTYAIGFIRAYANYLGLDGEQVLDSYKAASADVQARPDLALPVALAERSVPGRRILLVASILALGGYGVWYYVAAGEQSRPERVAAVPAELQPPTTRPAAAPSPAPASATAVVPAAPTAPTASGAGAATVARFSSGLLPSQPAVPAKAETAAASERNPPENAPGGAAETSAGSIDIRALADSWIQIRAADQSIVFARVLKTGETYRVPRPGLILRTGNAGALEILVDGKPAPSVGGLGTLRRNVVLDPEALRGGTAVRG